MGDQPKTRSDGCQEIGEVPDGSPQDEQKLPAAKPYAIGRWPRVRSQSNTDQEDAMMNGYGMGWGMGGYGGVGGLLAVLVVIGIVILAFRGRNA